MVKVQGQARDLFMLLLACVVLVCIVACSTDKTAPDVNRTSYTITQEQWTETAVRKVLHVFAYGGFSSDAQVKKWASMKPEMAINEMLTLKTSNTKLSPVDPSDTLADKTGTLKGLSTLWSADDRANHVKNDSRKRFSLDSWSSPARLWAAAVIKRGLNPVRQKIGLFETNYHLVANQNVGVSNRQIVTYYDSLMTALSKGTSYQDILAMAAISAAVATQYNHKDNRFIDGKFEGNEDFSREFFQLFFGILGQDDPDYHEFTTIRNTAKALTDMTVQRVKSAGMSYWSDTIKFGTDKHYPGALTILNQTIDGPTAKEKIQQLAQFAIAHRDSLKNLPILIVRGLADDNITDDKATIIRAIWADLEQKNLLLFLKRYAISTAFHNATRIKYWSSISRLTLIYSQASLTNREHYLELFDLFGSLAAEQVNPFRPTHDVFGSQTGLEASNTADVFKRAYNQAIDHYWKFARTHLTDPTDKKRIVWQKDWGRVMPKGADGSFRVKPAAEWLWKRFIGDGLKNFGTLERAHVYALLVSGNDLAYWLDKNAPLKTYSKDELETDRFLKERIGDVEKAHLNALSSTDGEKRREANRKIGMAVAFIIATPYMFAQEGK